ncbi:MAG: hypothetical protein ACWA5W_00340 [Phycisphaerales bacterium]
MSELPTLISHAKAITVACGSDRHGDKQSKQANHQETQQDAPVGVSCFLPQSRGVVEMVAHDGSCVLLAATGQMRSFVASRLHEDHSPHPTRTPSAKADLAPITARIIGYPTGSGFESDWIVHERAGVVDPGLYAKLNEQNRRALLVMDEQIGSWRVEDTQGIEPTEGAMVIGPILTHRAARALGETLDDVYELCRYPKELAQAPNGSVCAYKQMGRCPGACDGSEPMEAYRQRFGRAMESAQGGLEAWKNQLREEIEAASAQLDFEHAQHAKRSLEQVDKLSDDAIGMARPIAGMVLVCITPSVRKGWAMVWVFGAWGLMPIVAVGEEQVDHKRDELEQVITSSIDRLAGLACDRSVWFDRFALVARHWLAKPSKAKRRRVTIVDLRDEHWRSKIRTAVGQACEPMVCAQDDAYDEDRTHIKRSTPHGGQS